MRATQTIGRFVVVASLLLFATEITYSQDKSINISGIIMDADSLQAVPYVNIRLKDTFFGTVADNQGNFNFTASAGDTLRFSSIGYYDAYFIMSNQLMKGNTYTLIQLMRRETILLEEIVVFPFPEYEQLLRSFIEAEPDRDLESLKEDAINRVNKISREEYERNKNYYNVYHNNQLYNMTGIVPLNNFLNPINWSNFIEDLKSKKVNQKQK